MRSSSILGDAKIDVSYPGPLRWRCVSLAERRVVSASEPMIDFSSRCKSKAFHCEDSSTTRSIGAPLMPLRKVVRITTTVFASLANIGCVSTLLTMRHPCVMLSLVDGIEIVDLFSAGLPISDQASN